LQHFVLTNCSDTSRLVVSKLMFTRPDAIPAKIEPLSWCFAVVFLFGSILYFLYFIFMWGVQNNGVTLNSWMINAGTSFAQDRLVTEPLSIIFLFIFVFDVAKLELRGFYHAINNSMMKYSEEAAQTKAGSTPKQQLKANSRSSPRLAASRAPTRASTCRSRMYCSACRTTTWRLCWATTSPPSRPTACSVSSWASSW